LALGFGYREVIIDDCSSGPIGKGMDSMDEVCSVSFKKEVSIYFIYSLYFFILKNSLDVGKANLSIDIGFH